MDSISFAGNVVLTSTVEENGRQYACDGEMVTFTCQVIGTLSLQWDSPLFSDIVFPAGSTAPRSTSRSTSRLFVIATLNSISGSGINTNYSSTLLVNASREFARSNTTVECRNQLRVTQESRFTVAGKYWQTHYIYSIFWLSRTTVSNLIIAN